MATTTKQKQQAVQNLGKAISHPLRAQILTILAERMASPNEMAEELGDSVGNVSYHVTRLVKLDCIELVDERPVRGAVEHFYRATARPLVDLDEWKKLPRPVAEHFTGQAAQKIFDDIVLSAKANLLATKKDLHLSRTPLLLDTEGEREAMAIHADALAALLEVQARSAERMLSSGEAGVHISSSQVCIEVPAKAA